MSSSSLEREGAPLYRHTQPAWVILCSLIIPIGMVMMIVSQAGGGDRAVAAATAVTCGMMLLVAALFPSLTVIVDPERIYVRFGAGLIRKTIPLEQVETCVPVSNSWLWGWGIRMIPGGWMYNVSGLQSVELTMRDGSRFRIGSDDALGLSDAINARLTTR